MRESPSQPSDYGFQGQFSDDRLVLQRYTTASGILAAEPAFVAVPTSGEDLARLVRWAGETRSPLIPRGAGTGMPGGNVGPAVVVDMLTHFRTPPEILASTSRAVTEPGLTLAQVNHAARPFGLHLPVDPSSGERCTIGGMIANNAAGAHSVRYGATRRWVASLDLVLADGSKVHLQRGAESPPEIKTRLDRLWPVLSNHQESIRTRWPRVRKNSSGYALREFLEVRDPIDLFVGSEGTLGIITGATMRLAPLSPALGLLVLEFNDLHAATRAVLDLLPQEPLTCELLDRTFLDLARRGNQPLPIALQPELEALLLVEFEAGSPERLPHVLQRLESAAAPFASRMSSAVNPHDIARLWEIRHAASPIIAREAGRRVSMQFIEDSVVPVDRLTDYILGLRSILERHRLPAVIFGHAGDGNLHVNPLVDPHSPTWIATLQTVLGEVVELVHSLGGTLAGEHGDGRLRAPMLPRIWDHEIIECFIALKHAFDPGDILNPGVILPRAGQQPFDFLRYPA